MCTPSPAHTNPAYAQLDGYLDNLANAASQEKMTLAKLVTSKFSLAASVAKLTTKLANLTTAYALLANSTASPTLASSTHGGRPRSSCVYTVGGYCWTHGYKVHKNTCKHNPDGHKDCATHANTMHGSTTNKGWEDV